MRILLAIVISATALVGCGGEERRYDEEVRSNFLDECQVEADASSCARVLSCIEEEMTQDEFLYEESLMVLTDDLSDRLADVMARCMSESD